MGTGGAGFQYYRPLPTARYFRERTHLRRSMFMKIAFIGLGNVGGKLAGSL